MAKGAVTISDAHNLIHSLLLDTSEDFFFIDHGESRSDKKLLNKILATIEGAAKAYLDGQGLPYDSSKWGLKAPLKTFTRQLGRNLCASQAIDHVKSTRQAVKEKKPSVAALTLMRAVRCAIDFVDFRDVVFEGHARIQGRRQGGKKKKIPPAFGHVIDCLLIEFPPPKSPKAIWNWLAKNGAFRIGGEDVYHDGDSFTVGSGREKTWSVKSYAFCQHIRNARKKLLPTT